MLQPCRWGSYASPDPVAQLPLRSRRPVDPDREAWLPCPKAQVRDAETLQVLHQASLTGHLCVSSLHAVDTAKTISRIRDIGIPDFLIADCLRAVISPRLLRAICPKCKKPHTPEAKILKRFSPPGEADFFAGAGCEACHKTGFAEIRPIFESLFVDDEIRRGIKAGASEKELGAMAVQAGMRPLKDEALRLALQGVVSLEEAARVVG
jgi:type II secretory ATPase GspE/PulE/Tfp pilus assembly ATPase PilB-like protein